jgi:NAD(P)H-hydrate epimerase
LIEAVWTVLPDNGGAFTPEGVVVLDKTLQTADSIVIGPGWGLQEQNVNFLKKLLLSIPKTIPTLLDADGLKLLSQLDRWWTMLPDHCVLTPHPGEMSILTGLEIQEIQNNRWPITLAYARQWNVTVVLKGAMTVIANPVEGVYISPVSDSALATAGSGDVLAGVMGGLMAQGLPIQAASLLGVWIHGMAGQAAHQRFGTDFSVTAIDILDSLPDAFIKAKEAGI